MATFTSTGRLIAKPGAGRGSTAKGSAKTAKAAAAGKGKGKGKAAGAKGKGRTPVRCSFATPLVRLQDVIGSHTPARIWRLEANIMHALQLHYPKLLSHAAKFGGLKPAHV
jgi:hypothetical protein